MGLVILFLAIATVFDPGTIHIGVHNAPTIIYNKNKDEWIIPSYEQLKHGIRCLERNDVRCLRGK